MGADIHRVPPPPGKWLPRVKTLWPDDKEYEPMLRWLHARMRIQTSRKSPGVAFWATVGVSAVLGVGAVKALGPHAWGFVAIAAGMAVATAVQMALAAGARKHLDDPALHAPERPRTCGGAGSGRTM